MSEALDLRNRGEFEKATRLLQSYLTQTSGTLEPSDRRNVEFEIERIRRIRLDYTLSREKALEQVRRRIPDFSEEEFDRYEREGCFDSQIIDGQKLYVKPSASNLLLRVPELKKRQPQKKDSGTYRKLYAHMRQVNDAQKLTTSSQLLLPQDLGVTYTLTVNKDAVPDGQTIRCWLPFVRNYPFQNDTYIIEADPPQYVLAPPEAPHRTIYMEKQAKKGQPTLFQVRFVYRCWARANRIDPALVQPYRKDAPEYQYYTAENKPHIDLANEELKRLNSQIVNGETNPYLIARRIYDWIAENMIYQYAREYSTLDNISYYCISRRAGDCGQHGMAFIALCRMNGIPARWQTGWECFEGSGNNMHDWAEFYVEPYGWLPADVDMAVNALHNGPDELDTTQSKELADWFFANQDNFRLAVNSDFGAPLFPPKTDFRSETVDFQRGEVEADGKNLYFDQWDYSMDFAPIPHEQALAIAKRYALAAPAEPPPATTNSSVTTTTTVAPVNPTTPTLARADTATSAPAAAADAPTSASAR